ncbi:MAG: hypothetical protein EB150_05765 [Nitrososphaeria archaeon]|nr:hypothetical protein [Nitrososphaeria archaeon]NDB51810.1 hypothetical protein [Nitrosopumilaceae archaeon]NDB88325.1 hypothetical protein [Nitrososphaerota archaeon]NDB46822.1 hypothetical protein [Nitrososphaeria archaeon]NDB63616.1 hypothetical protein [Nitrosopumilaceae archaeon]
MAKFCKGLCTEYRAQKIPNGFRYCSGQKRCTYCSLYLQVSGINCPCCGCRLRSKSRHKLRN